MAGALGVMWPVYYFMKIFGIAPYLMQNLLVFFFQTLIGYFSYKYVRVFQKTKTSEPLEAFFILCLSAFAPMIAWRVAYGHLNLVFGIFTVIGITYLIHAILNKIYSAMDLTLGFLGFSISINFPAFQTFAHIIYLLPFYIVLVRIPREKFGSILDYKILAWVLIFLVINIPFMFDLYSYYLFGDSSRGSSIDIYSYAPYTWESLLSTLTWQNDYISLADNFFLWHELHYPIAFGFLSLGLIKNSIQKWTALVLGILILGFCLQIPGLDFFQYLPLLKHMRVPQRIIIPISFMMTLGGCIWLIGVLPNFKLSKNEISIYGTALAIFLVLLRYMDFYIEPILLMATVGLVLCTKRKFNKTIPPLLLVISLLGIKSFYLKVMPFLNFYQITRDIQNLSIPIKKANPFERYFFDFNNQEFGANTALAFETSSLNGNFYGTGRFSRFIHRMRKINYNPVTLNWSFSSKDPHSQLLAHLFNIRNKVELTDKGIKVSKIEVDHEGIIFPEKILFEDELRKTISGLQGNWKTAYVKTLYQEKLKALEGCNPGSLKTQYDLSLKIQGIVEKDCLIILPTNYLNSLEWKVNQIDETQNLFPVDYTLTGIIMRKGKIDGELKGKFF